MYAIALVIAITLAWILLNQVGKVCRFYQYRRRVNRIPGPNFTIPFLGIVHKLLTMPKEDRIDWYKDTAARYKDGCFRTWIGTNAMVHINKPEHIEVILRSTQQITKSITYENLKPWLGHGLLTSTGLQWHRDRKLISPAFHFAILGDFSQVMLEKTAIFINCIEQENNSNGGKPFDIFPLSARFTLDVVCETAMGVNIFAQEEPGNEYTNAVHTITRVTVNRFFRPWLKPDWIFYKTPLGKEFKAAVCSADDLCTRGHDTSAALIAWTFFCLGVELDVQKKVHDELDRVIGDLDNVATLERLPDLKYLDRVIKEVLRLYPVATTVSRHLTEDMQIGEYIIPKDVTLAIHIYQLHRDPSVWTDPLRFDPDRFLPENTKGRHPYAYVPFSAGPRNCIGQKFAKLETKLALVQVLRKFTVRSVDSHSTIKKYSNIILRPVDGIYVQMTKRSLEE